MVLQLLAKSQTVSGAAGVGVRTRRSKTEPNFSPERKKGCDTCTARGLQEPVVPRAAWGRVPTGQGSGYRVAQKMPRGGVGWAESIRK